MDEFNEAIDFAEDLEATQKAYNNKFKSFVDKERVEKMAELGYPRKYVEE